MVSNTSPVYFTGVVFCPFRNACCAGGKCVYFGYDSDYPGYGHCTASGIKSDRLIHAVANEIHSESWRY